MTNEDKMLKLVLSDKHLSELYKYNPEEYDNIEDALIADNPIIVAVAKIIRGINGKSDKSNFKENYNEVFNYLNQNLL